MNVTDNEYNTGISIYCDLTDFTHENDNCKVLVPWEEKKRRFWNIMKTTFLKYYQ
jgi:hypothetical protein